MTEQFSNNATSTLAASIGVDDTSLIIARAASGFSTSGTFRLFLDGNEIVLVGAATVVGATLVCSQLTRAAEPCGGVQTASAHLAGASVLQIPTAGALAQLKADVLANNVDVLPPAPQVGAFSLQLGQRIWTVDCSTENAIVTTPVPSVVGETYELLVVETGLGSFQITSPNPTTQPVQDPVTLLTTPGEWTSPGAALLLSMIITWTGTFWQQRGGGA